MLTRAEFVALLDERLGLAVTPQDLDRDVDELSGWDSVMLWQLQIVLERRTGRTLPFDRLLSARTLGAVLSLVGGGDHRAVR